MGSTKGQLTELNSLLRGIPSIGKFLDSASGQVLVQRFGAGLTKVIARTRIEEIRAGLQDGSETSAGTEVELADSIELELYRLAAPSGRNVINGSGIILHTGLGRAPMGAPALATIAEMGGYTVLEVDLDSGHRSQRDVAVESLLQELSGAEAATVVNNCAAATFIVLNAVTKGKEAIISRGQLIEIGGSYRMPDVMEASGAIMREVGTTNKTHLADYENAINENTGCIVHVHMSNYKIRGFTSSPNIAELCELGRKYNIPVIDDLGSGALVRPSLYGFTDEAFVPDSVKAGADAVFFSGDKMICGPQAGIIVGSKDLIKRIRKNAFARMFRVDKMTMGALQSTFVSFLNGTHERDLPLYQMLTRSIDDLRRNAQTVVDAVAPFSTVSASIVDSDSFIGAGAIPDEAIPSVSVRMKLSSPTLSATKLSWMLRQGVPSILGYIDDEAVHLNMRTVAPNLVEPMATKVASILSRG